MNSLDIDNFIMYFKDTSVFETTDIADYYRQTNEMIKPTTINWRVHSLVRKGILQRIGKGKFALGSRKMFVLEISSKLKSVYQKIHKEFPFIEICVWHTSIFNEFMQHQPGKFYYMVEVDKETVDAVFYFLKENNFSVFLNPTRDIIEKYLPDNKDIWIVKSLVSESPTQNVDGVSSISIEKMLVDIFCDDVLFASQQGAEMRTIFNEAVSKYSVNQSRMLRYADRRNKKDCLIKYIETIPNYRQFIQLVPKYRL